MLCFNSIKRISFQTLRPLTRQKRSLILGIETSCDDTGCAVLDSEGNILGESLNSQQLTHLKLGGIIPPIARDLHRQNIENVVEEAIKQAGLEFRDLDAIATTVEPGLPMSLCIGMKYGKHLCRLHKKPFIPIHHMKAHALTIRMIDKSLQFPFVVLLISGGHCLLAVAHNIEDFILLGQTNDNAPGEVMDKIARRLKLRNLPEFSTLSGGQAIELAASKADNPFQFEFTPPLFQYKDCNFSFSGLHNIVTRAIIKEEKIHNVPPDGVIPTASNLCAGFLLTITRHVCHRLQRGIEYLEMKTMIPEENKVVVMSGGVACNNFITRGVQLICDEFGFKLLKPPPKLCTDNGIMIAWNGVEKWKCKQGIFEDLNQIDIKKSSPIGRSIADEITLCNIKCKWVKISNLFKANNF